ncbi:MAG: FtsX-like permease family protein [Armatimonadetes bacterium]|nr:FtsX-like permease family protein [Armatimonadota bacterium]
MASKQEAGIRRQIELPLSQAVKMARDSIRVRFWRSMITAAGIFLGIAFLESVLMTSAILKSIGDGYDDVVRTRQNWLVVMSLLVSTVGVVNSMLMSVNERYREIGTMKCLGALDRLVVKVFLIEAGFTGFLASVVGAIVGTGAMALVLWVRFGGKFWGALSGASVEVLVNIGIGIVIGTVLALMAAFYPAWRAAKMPPAAALRSEF